MSDSRNNEERTRRNIRLLTVEDIAAELQVSVRGIWRNVSIGKIPKPIYIGRLARWKKSTIEKWLDDISE